MNALAVLGTPQGLASKGLAPMRLYRTSNGTRRRRKAYVPVHVRRETLKQQKGRCLYCGNLFGAVVGRGTATELVALAWDHFTPYAYSDSNEYHNLVASCAACNAIKSDKMFDTIGDARAFITARRARLGYIDIPRKLRPPRVRRDGPSPNSGTRNGRARLTGEQVTDMRRRYAAGGQSYRKLAATHGVAHTTIADAITGRNWAHLPKPEIAGDSHDT